MGKITQLWGFTKSLWGTWNSSFGWSSAYPALLLPPPRWYWPHTSLRQETAVPTPGEALEYQKTAILVPSPSPLVHTLDFWIPAVWARDEGLMALWQSHGLLSHVFPVPTATNSTYMTLFPPLSVFLLSTDPTPSTLFGHFTKVCWIIAE